ncbi:slightly ste11-like protein [Paramarasmius palmivorus]|uniref:Slightly ste11-like protein n=1 Tax=Paramarasmius palmivorus TaxID=297713 RepID=A0AAW0BM34_9AGAR
MDSDCPTCVQLRLDVIDIDSEWGRESDADYEELKRMEEEEEVSGIARLEPSHRPEREATFYLLKTLRNPHVSIARKQLVDSYVVLQRKLRQAMEELEALQSRGSSPSRSKRPVMYHGWGATMFSNTSDVIVRGGEFNNVSRDQFNLGASNFYLFGSIPPSAQVIQFHPNIDQEIASKLFEIIPRSISNQLLQWPLLSTCMLWNY